MKILFRAQAYYGQSNGIKLGYLIVRYLHELGFDAAIACPDSATEGRRPPPGYAPPVLYDCDARLHPAEEDIVIYPEIVDGNPLSARRVVRYLMNRPYYLNGMGIDYAESDYVTACSRAIDPELPQLCLLSDDFDWVEEFRGEPKRDQVAVYFGKTDLAGLNSRLEDLRRITRRYRHVTLITRRHPMHRTALFRTIARSRLLVSFDPISNMGYEATLLGTPVLMLDDSFGALKAVDGIPLYGFSRSPDDVERASRDVGNALEFHKAYIASQREMVSTWVQSVIAHFQRFDDPSEAAYRASRAAFIAGRVSLDERRFRDQGEALALKNINYPAEIPQAAHGPLRKRMELGITRVLDGCVRIAKQILKASGAFQSVKAIYHRSRSRSEAGSGHV